MTLRNFRDQYAYDTRKKMRLPRPYPSYVSFVGSGSPEGVVTAPVGTQYTDTVASVKYEKTSGTGNTGWTLA